MICSDGPLHDPNSKWAMKTLAELELWIRVWPMVTTKVSETLLEVIPRCQGSMEDSRLQDRIKGLILALRPKDSLDSTRGDLPRLDILRETQLPECIREDRGLPLLCVMTRIDLSLSPACHGSRHICRRPPPIKTNRIISGLLRRLQCRLAQPPKVE